MAHGPYGGCGPQVENYCTAGLTKVTKKATIEYAPIPKPVATSFFFHLLSLQAASTGISRMNVSGCVASALPHIPPMFFAQPANPADGFVTSNFSQALLASQQQALHSSRDSTQSPKK